MKKVCIASLLMLVAVAFASCSKTCTCTTTQEMPDMEPIVTTTEVTIEKGKCKDMNATQESSMGISQTVDCVSA